MGELHRGGTCFTNRRAAKEGSYHLGTKRPPDDSSEKNISAHGYSHSRCIHMDALLIVDQAMQQF